jgi:hypothetical protein
VLKWPRYYGIIEMVFSNIGEKCKRLVIIVHQKKGKNGFIIFFSIFLEVGIGGEHPKVDLTFIFDRILSMFFSK